MATNPTRLWYSARVKKHKMLKTQKRIPPITSGLKRKMTPDTNVGMALISNFETEKYNSKGADSKRKPHGTINPVVV
jgi:hypothetical protein